MKKLFFSLFIVLMAQTFNACTKQDTGEKANTHQTIQADDYGGDDEVIDDDDDDQE